MALPILHIRGMSMPPMPTIYIGVMNLGKPYVVFGIPFLSTNRMVLPYGYQDFEATDDRPYSQLNPQYQS